MLVVRLDYSTIAFEKLTGIGRYVVELSKVFQEMSEVCLQGACKISRWHRRKFIARHLPNVKIFSIPTLKTAPDIFHAPDYNSAYIGKAKKVVTIHDLATFHSHLVDKQRLETAQKGDIQKILKNPKWDAIITISEFMKQEIMQFFPNLDKPIFVTPLAANHKHFKLCEKKNSQPYLLFVGNLDKRKNVLGLCQAFEMIAPKYPDLRLILAGSQEGFEAEKVLSYVAQSRFQKQFIFRNFVSETELQSLYAQAWAFVFPSFYEGFGIPILEAMHYNLPILTSANSAMQEIADKGALYINPYDVMDIAEGLEKIISDENLRKMLVTNAQKRLQFFSWQKTAEKTLQVYRTL
ncbi:MAG: glycosyltransferase family 1 protein [Raineya sp.]|nr:glycosyltransferase family 4 protein [Raineya sp.]MDW8296230.1 glycosyltransferase family 1 protein [Raineya sp.]